MSDNIKELIEGVEPIKISIIMQSYLADYPGSRGNSVHKIKRAIDSFLAQMYKNCELIVVADGCKKTQQIVSRFYENENSVKLIYIERDNDQLSTYDLTEDGKKYYRGFPRRVGVGAATGDLITYMDSDDYLLPEFTATLMLTYNAYPDMDWYINTAWYDHASANWPQTKEMYGTKEEDGVYVEGLEYKWVQTVLRPGAAILAPWLFAHKPHCTTKWRDTIGGSEDADFNKRLRNEYTKGIAIQTPIYARCHFAGRWDY